MKPKGSGIPTDLTLLAWWMPTQGAGGSLVIIERKTSTPGLPPFYFRRLPPAPCCYLHNSRKWVTPRCVCVCTYLPTRRIAIAPCFRVSQIDIPMRTMPARVQWTISTRAVFVLLDVGVHVQAREYGISAWDRRATASRCTFNGHPLFYQVRVYPLWLLLFNSWLMTFQDAFIRLIIVFTRRAIK